MGLYDDTGTLAAVGSMAESYKPKLEEGSGRAQTLRTIIILSDFESVELAFDSSMEMTTLDSAVFLLPVANDHSWTLRDLRGHSVDTKMKKGLALG